MGYSWPENSLIRNVLLLRSILSVNFYLALSTYGIFDYYESGFTMADIIPIETITERIFEFREQKVMIDADLAILYQVPTKALNQAVKRNPGRFPADFMFQLTLNERDELVTLCDRLTKLKHSSVMPYAFTESGVAMLSSVLNSEHAIQINVSIIRAFIQLRSMLINHEALRLAIEGLEKRMCKNERDIQIAIKAIQSILTPAAQTTSGKRMGFCPPGKPST